MKTEYRFPNGDAVPNGLCVTADTFTTTFSVTVRHTGTAGPEKIKELVQQRFEVTAITTDREVITVVDRRPSILPCGERGLM